VKARYAGAALTACLTGLVLGIAQPRVTVAAAQHSSACPPGAVVQEHLRAPKSVPLNQPFQVKVNVLNCTHKSQSVMLEGRQQAPDGCSAPVIDPLVVTVPPESRYTLREDVPGQSCSGTFTVTWAVYQNNVELAHRTRHISIG
jgi:hypothetical protein